LGSFANCYFMKIALNGFAFTLETNLHIQYVKTTEPLSDDNTWIFPLFLMVPEMTEILSFQNDEVTMFILRKMFDSWISLLIFLINLT
jgi:hypothetical protein